MAHAQHECSQQWLTLQGNATKAKYRQTIWPFMRSATTTHEQTIWCPANRVGRGGKLRLLSFSLACKADGVRLACGEILAALGRR